MKINPRLALVDKVAIIIGASSGIGEATAREFAQAGAWVVLAAVLGQFVVKKWVRGTDS